MATWQTTSAVASRPTALLKDPHSLVLGNPEGDVAIIEFFDYTCPYCKAAEPTLQQLLQNEKGVKLIIKEFPILRPESLVAAKAALASAKQGKYESFHRAVLGLRGQLTEPAIFEIAKTVKLDIQRLRKDMDAPKFPTRSLRISTLPARCASFRRQPSSSADTWSRSLRRRSISLRPLQQRARSSACNSPGKRFTQAASRLPQGLRLRPVQAAYRTSGQM